MYIIMPVAGGGGFDGFDRPPPPQPEPRPTMEAIIRIVPSRYLFLNLTDYFRCVSIRWFKQRLYSWVSIISSLTVRLSLKRRSFWMLISHFDSLRGRFVKITGKEAPSRAPACNGKRGNLPSRKKWKCWRVQKSLILIIKWWLDGGAICNTNRWVAPYAGTMLQDLIFKICFWLLGFRPRPLPEFHSWTLLGVNEK